MFKSHFLLFFLPVLANSQEQPTICIDQGTCYKGSWISLNNSSSSARYASFQGIRYAQPPIGKLRFKSPQPYIAEAGIYDVSKESNVSCPQIGQNGLEGQEDCLLMNIYIPNIVFDNPQIKLPVMFWIHGGGLTGGSNSFRMYGPQQFMDKGSVVIITVNYRLGPIGFLSMGTEDVPGNAGLRDQTLAMKWVQENVANFGGDSSSVTIFGESAGSLSIAMHLLSPLSKGLFQRAILQSGTTIAPSWGQNTPQHALQYASLVSHNLGCDEEEDELACLQNRDLNEVMNQLNLIEGNLQFIPYWMPVPDKDFTSMPYLLGDPEQLLESGEFNTEVEIIIGTNADEGILALIPLFMNFTTWEDEKYLLEHHGAERLFNIPNSEVNDDDISNKNKIVEFYVGSYENINDKHRQAVFDMFTDSDFLYGTYKTIYYFLKHSMTVYKYILTYQGQFSITQLYGFGPVGVCHADDLLYMWDYPELPLSNEDDKLLRDVMTSAWINFATYGDPTPPDTGYSWTPVTSLTEHQYLNISGPMPIMTNTPSHEMQARMALWSLVIN